MTPGMKRANGFATARAQKKTKVPQAKPKEPDYCDVEPRRDDTGNVVWPAPEENLKLAKSFIQECAASGQKTLLVPDKDADGLSSGVILYRTLELLGLDSSNIDIHLVAKGNTVHDAEERAAMSAKTPKAIVPSEDDFEQSCAYLACIGTHGDLGNTLKWKPPFPDLNPTLKQHTKKAINDAVALLNAPRRTAERDVSTAWGALLASKGPKDLLNNPRLLAARREINEEVERHTHAPPKFSIDGKIAVLKINSQAQVHPVIATRWAGYLNSKLLEIVMVANYGYLPGKVNFSCRIARSVRGRDPPVNIIESLKAAAALSTDGLQERLGPSFARGHKEASGGIVDTEAFEDMMKLLRVGEKPEKKDEDAKRSPNKKKTIETSPQKNTLGNYFQKK
ncbi:MAG: hypothetical protein Q9227_009396 [Pyrenula ochraceoflavens]